MAVNLETADVGLPDGDAVQARDGPVPPGIALLDEPLGQLSTREFQPRLESAEADTSSQSFAQIVRYDVPDGRVALLDEVSIDVPTNGEIIISVQGSDPTTFSGPTAYTAVWNGAYLYPGQRVRVLHRSADGSSVTNRASITVREV